MPCIHHRSDFFVGIGHPRCGTGFTAAFLQSAGLKIGHEFVLDNGIISWMLPAEKYNYPYKRDALGPLGGFSRIFCIARSPLASINSIIPENDAKPSFQLRKEIIRKRFGHDFLPAADDSTGILTSIISYTLWFELCMSFLPDFIYRVDHPEDDRLLSDYVGKILTRNDKIRRNSRPDIRATRFAPSLLPQFPKEWLIRYATIAEGLGYPEDASIIWDAAGGRTEPEPLL